MKGPDGRAGDVISILLPSRGRPGPLAESIATLRTLAADPDGLQVLVAADPDDPATARAALDMSAVVWVAPLRYGYANLHKYVNRLATMAHGKWLMLWNDDARMLTEGWDAVVTDQQPGVLWPHSNDLPGCNTFPIWPAAWTTALGHVSLSPHCDSWIQHLGDTLGLQRRIPVTVLHDRADLTGGHDDATRAESAAGYRTTEFYSPAMQQARRDDVRALRRMLTPEDR